VLYHRSKLPLQYTSCGSYELSYDLRLQYRLLGQNSRIKAGCEQRQPASVNNINTQTCLQQRSITSNKMTSNKMPQTILKQDNLHYFTHTTANYSKKLED
jgi:hypothetical protein